MRWRVFLRAVSAVFQRWRRLTAAVMGGSVLWGSALAFVADTSAQPAPDTSGWVDVRLHHTTDLSSARLTAHRGSLAVLLPHTEAAPLRLSPNDALTLGHRHRDVFAAHDNVTLYARALHLAPAPDATWTLEVPPGTSRTYTGRLRIRRDSSGLQLVNRVSLSEYVASVVAGEYGLDGGAGARAMAVAARTYALFSASPNGDTYDHVDGTASQVYKGQRAITEASRNAAQATRGEVLTYNGTPIQAVYFSSSGGHTANNEDVWTGSDPLPYLRGQADPHDRPSPKHRWTARIDRAALLQALSVHHGTSVNGFLLGERTPHGRLRAITLLQSDGARASLEAGTFRTVVNARLGAGTLKSTWFDAQREGDAYVFEGRGHGHGVGLNQWGAHTMATQGKSYREILSFYYPGTQIRPLDGLTPPPPLAEDPAPEAPPASRIGW